MLKKKLEEAFAALSQLEEAMPQPAAGSELELRGLSFREELVEAVQRLKSAGGDRVAADPKDPTEWY